MDLTFEEVRKNELCFRHLESSQIEQAQTMLNQLIELGTPMADVVERIVHSRYQNDLLTSVLSYVQEPGQRLALIDALVVEYRFQGVGETVGNLLSISDELFYVLSQHAELVSDPDHYLYGRLSVERYWESRVRHHLAKRKPDTERAYEEVWKARRGNQEMEEVIRRKLFKKEYSLTTRASARCLERLVHLIYKQVETQAKLNDGVGINTFLLETRPSAQAFASELQRSASVELLLLDRYFHKLKKCRRNVKQTGRRVSHMFVN